MKLPQSSLLRFAIVGSLGFAVDGGALVVLVHGFGWSPFAARCVGFPLALTVTWVCNRLWTFEGGRDRAPAQQYGLYTLIQLAGLGINMAVFALLLWLSPLFAQWPVLALAAGSLAAMGFTYLASRRFAFASKAADAARP